MEIIMNIKPENKEIMEKLNNMTIDYKLVDNPDDVNISYRDIY